MTPCWGFPAAFKIATHDVKHRCAMRHFVGCADQRLSIFASGGQKPVAPPVELLARARDLAAETLSVGARSRAVSFQIGSYPEAAKKLAHSVGVKSDRSWPILFQRPSTVRSAALRSRAFSLEKAFSSGVYFS